MNHSGDYPGGMIEVLNRFGQVQQRVAWRGLTLNVGRAYDNDVIVEDPYVCPLHLQLRPAEEGVEAADMDSINGIYTAGERRRQAIVGLSSGETLKFGHSQLRYRDAGYQVPQALRDIAAFGLLRWFSQPLSVLVFVLLAVVSLLLDIALDQVEPITLNRTLSDLLVPGIGLISWIGLWALINRAASQRWNFLAHCGIAAFFTALWFLASHGLSLLAFGMSWDGIYPWLDRLLAWLVFGLMIYSHLRYATHGRRGWQLLAAFLGVGALLSWGALDQIYQDSEFSSLPKVQPIIKPPAFQLRQGISSEEFFDKAGQLGDDAADQDREEAN